LNCGAVRLLGFEIAQCVFLYPFVHREDERTAKTVFSVVFENREAGKFVVYPVAMSVCGSMADADVGLEFDRTDAPDGFEGGCET